MGAQRATYAVIHYGPEHFWSFCLTLAHAFRKSLRFSTSAIGGRGSWSAVSGCVRTRVCLHGELARGLGGAVEFSSTARVPCGQTATLHRWCRMDSDFWLVSLRIIPFGQLQGSLPTVFAAKDSRGWGSTYSK